MLVLIGMGVGGYIAATYWSTFGIEVIHLNLDDSMPTQDRNHLRIGLLISHLFSFLIPAGIFLYLFKRKDFNQFLQFNMNVKFSQIAIWSIIIFASYPLIIQLTKINELIPIPEIFIKSQDQSFILLRHTLEMNSPSEFLLTILLVGFAAAIGEELIFRKIIQNHFIEKFKNPHLGIFLAASIFGLFHLQLERVIPLVFLGLILGYSYYITKNFAIPLLLHLFNNSLQVVGIYSTSSHGEIPDIQNVPDVPTVVIIGSCLLVMVLFFYSTKIKN